jgi:ElaB/YqjD/DUF883 family membrane-anchored ribosome-binding protein
MAIDPEIQAALDALQDQIAVVDEKVDDVEAVLRSRIQERFSNVRDSLQELRARYMKRFPDKKRGANRPQRSRVID